jgi:NADH-quinone oxidoreductase subunit J
MLLGVDRAESIRIDPIRIQRPLAAIIGVGLIGLIGGAIIQSRDAISARGQGIAVAGEGDAVHDSNVKQLANDLFSNHVFAFELTSVLLVIAVVGTVLLARRPNKRGASDESDETRDPVGVQ